MAPTINNRKRSRSQEDYDYTVQSKQFINEQTINMGNQHKMKEIHGKFLILNWSYKSDVAIIFSWMLYRQNNPNAFPKC